MGKELSNYQNLVDEVFREEKITVNEASSNNITGAIKNNNNFDEFTKNFKNRLIRLKKTI